METKGVDQKGGNHIVTNDDLIDPVFSGVEQHIGIVLVVFKKASYLFQTATHFFRVNLDLIGNVTGLLPLSDGYQLFIKCIVEQVISPLPNEITQVYIHMCDEDGHDHQRKGDLHEAHKANVMSFLCS